MQPLLPNRLLLVPLVAVNPLRMTRNTRWSREVALVLALLVISRAVSALQ